MDYPLFCFHGQVVALHRLHNLIYRLQTTIDQANRDDSVRALLLKMDKVYTFLTTAEMEAILSMKAIVERITRQTVECSYFIQAYCGNRKFRKLTDHDIDVGEFIGFFQGTRLLNNLFSSKAKTLMQDYSDVFDKLLQEDRKSVV